MSGIGIYQNTANLLNKRQLLFVSRNMRNKENLICSELPLRNLLNATEFPLSLFYKIYFGNSKRH